MPIGANDNGWGLDPRKFGRHGDGSAIDAASLYVEAPSIVEIRLPADLVAGSELVTTAMLDPKSGAEGSVQVGVQTDRLGSLAELRGRSGARGRRKRRRGSGSSVPAMIFARGFRAALCYVQIVPVNEVVTLTLFHREDEPLCRLLLDDAEKARLNRLWDELHFISQDALTLVDAFAQLMEFATQDSDPKLFEPFRKPIHDRADAYRAALVAAEPRQLNALIEFAAQAYRRPLSVAESDELPPLVSRAAGRRAFA